MRQLTFDLIKSCLGDANTSRFGQTSQPRSDVDAITIYPVPYLNDISKVDANAKLHLLVFGQIGIPDTDIFLNRHSTLYCINYTGKLSKQIVAQRIHYSAAVFLDNLGNSLQVSYNGTNGAIVILSHKSAVIIDIGNKDCGEPTFEVLCGHKRTFQMV